MNKLYVTSLHHLTEEQIRKSSLKMRGIEVLDLLHSHLYELEDNKIIRHDNWNLDKFRRICMGWPVTYVDRVAFPNKAYELLKAMLAFDGETD